MEVAEAIVIVLIVAIVIYLAVRASKSKPGTKSSFHGGCSTCEDNHQELASALAAHRSWQSQKLASRVGVRNDAAGYGPAKPPNPIDQEPARTRNGQYLSSAKLADAEQNAWTPHSYTTGHFDAKLGSQPGKDLTQQMGNSNNGDYSNSLSTLAIDARTHQNHKDWVDEVKPYSQGAMAVDDLDEAVLMSMPRTGITAFRALPVPQGPCTLQITEIGPESHAEQFKKLHF